MAACTPPSLVTAACTALRPNGSIYAIRTAALRTRRTFYPPNTAPLVMLRTSSVNIDTADDFELAAWLLTRR